MNGTIEISKKLKGPSAEPGGTSPSVVFSRHHVSERRCSYFYCFLAGIVSCAVSQFVTHVLWTLGLTFQGQGTGGDLNNQSVMYSIVVLALCAGGGVAVIALASKKQLLNFRLFPTVAVAVWTLLILGPIAVRSDDHIPLRTGLGWIVLETFLIWVTLPVCIEVALLHACAVGVLHTAVVICKGLGQTLFVNQLMANVILLIGTNALGAMAYHCNEKRQRAAFLDTRQTLEVKDAMELAAKEQKRLLFSVLPRHLADTMAKDLEASAASNGVGGGAFKKIYMNRHEPVSILFADIVGFTAMSAGMESAAKLVELLNDLFSTFDTLSDKYKQVRIKILGDCYYCICGAPEPQDDHAVMCVYMGLAVVEAIKMVQERTKSAVDMRVGIHSGAVLAGVLGQRQWQFDVYSQDVTLANKMESSGKPGFVHISDQTLSFLSGQFEVQPGHGEDREEKLKSCGIKTWFITKTLKPFEESNENGAEGGPHDHADGHGVDAYGERLVAHMAQQHGNFSKLVNRVTLQFKDSAKEAEYASEKDPATGLLFFGFAAAVGAATLASIFAISLSAVGLTVGIVLAVLISGAGVAILIGKTEMFDKPMIHIAAQMLCFLGAGLACFSFMTPCFLADSSGLLSNRSSSAFSIEAWTNLSCYFPAYFPIFIVLIMFSLSIISSIGSWIKNLAICLLMTVVVALLNLDPLRGLLTASEAFSFSSEYDLLHESIQAAIFLIFVFVILLLLNRAFEISCKSLFQQKCDIVHLKEQAVELRSRNEALMCNIMPQHVAEHFMDKTKNHDELYCQTYDEVGLLFASMPNFADFYTEDAVNNQGLECLRFLNEVISDYDAILDYSQFKEKIIKIKTIGSSYMAASGLNPHIQVKAGESTRERWRHLSLLVEFAFEMKNILDRINAESYNQFALRIGLNHGPVTAGVIGATKPAYDTWGNTVNVASRMESTGKVGNIQVTEDCYKILRVYGYKFEFRGRVEVKGKGQLLTYFLVSRGRDELSDYEIETLEKQEAAAKATEKLPPPEVY